MSKRINFNTAVTSGKIGQATKARVTVKEGRVMIRFTDRASAANLGKDQLLKDLEAKGNARRLGLPNAFADFLPEPGSKLALIEAKYGWYALAPMNDDLVLSDKVILAGSVSA